MDRPAGKIVLGSRSPRRREILGYVFSPERVEVLPPRSADEPGFADRRAWPEIEARLKEIARAKCDDVVDQIAGRNDVAAVVTADTVIVGGEADGRLVVLGQPPDYAGWAEVVRGWFHRYYLGKTHFAATAFCVAIPGGRRFERLVRSSIAFDAAAERWLEWYVTTGEPRGKAGGYGLQGAGGLFAARVDGSLSNVVGLPLRELLDVFEECGLIHLDSEGE